MKPSQTHLPIIMMAGGLILILGAFSDLPQAGSFDSEADFLPPVKPINETCLECHGNPGKLKTDLNDPACLECHSADDPLYLDENSMEGNEPVPLLSHPVAKPVSMKGSPSLPPSTEMIFIPPGPFLMGSNGRTNVEGSGDADEAPLHKVYLDGYSIDKYEVTNAQYKAFMDAAGRRPPKHWNGNSPPPGKENHPVIYVDWFEANEYCHWVGKRLPTEEEWEKAARGPEGLRFPWGNDFDPMKANTPQHWLALNRPADTTSVGSFPNGKSPYGLYDMAGNVYEWTSSWYKPYPNNRVFNVHYGEKNKIVRGGSWYDCLSYGCGLSAPSFNRSRFAPAIRNKSFGFRCAK
jgi:iron(II)-dependent oxidoreductase